MARLLNEGLVLDNHLVFIETVDAAGDLFEVKLEGIIECVDLVFIQVDKRLVTSRNSSGQLQVRTVDYKYHAWLAEASGGTRNLIRYCTAHGMDGEDREGLHCHVFDLATGQERDVIGVELENLPTLGDFIPLAVDLGQAAKQSQPEAGVPGIE